MVKRTTKHTPGPWRLGSLIELGHIPVVARNAKGRDVTIASVHLQAGRKEEERNADLIAAAPEMAAACRDALVTIEYGFKGTGGQVDPDGDVRRQLRAALKKAGVHS
jgi:hypothetical protein